MTHNRTYVCPVCGELKRYPLPKEMSSYGLLSERLSNRINFIAKEQHSAWIMRPPAAGHWRHTQYVYRDFVWPKWLMHCDKPLFLLGRRAAQAATRLSNKERVIWVKLGARIMCYPNKSGWRAILKKEQLVNDAWLV